MFKMPATMQDQQAQFKKEQALPFSLTDLNILKRVARQEKPYNRPWLRLESWNHTLQDSRIVTHGASSS